MHIQLKKIPKKQKPVLERLMQLYLYDFSKIDDIDIGQDALFEYGHLDSYWSDPSRLPFLIYVEEKIAGFVLVNSYTCLAENTGGHSIAEFFVLPGYRRKGVGKAAAFYAFDKFPGKWEVREIEANVDGQRFWRNIIGDYTAGNFTDKFVDNELWRGPVQSFDSTTSPVRGAP